jgi:hypothetical protein
MSLFVGAGTVKLFGVSNRHLKDPEFESDANPRLLKGAALVAK